MPGNYKRKSTRKSWSQEDMNEAIKAVKENKMGWLLASKHFNVPQATLRRHYYRTPVNLGRFKPTFNADMEKTLVDHMLEFESRLFGFNTTEIRKLAFEFAEKLGLDHRFDKNKKIAGWDWLKGFRERNPNISLRAPEPTSAARARAFNKPQVMNFFSLLEKAVTDNEIQAHRIYNMDESGLNTVQKPPKVFASKGKKQVGAVTSAERGEHFTVVACANAIGNYVPPALIIPKKNYKAEYFDGTPPGSLELCHPSGYMTGDLFFKWMRHFVAFVNASLANKVLLILDGHSSHKNLDALEFAKANGVIMLCFPPHCTHRMQPTDLSFFGPLQAYYDREMSTWMKNHPGRTIGLYQVAQLFGRAYEIAASVRNITSGFEKSGIYPFNPHIFPEDLYLPSAVTENELINDEEPVASSSSQPQVNYEECDSSESTDIDEQLMAVATANSYEQINFETCDTSRDVESRHSSPTILVPNVATHLLIYGEQSQVCDKVVEQELLDNEAVEQGQIENEVQIDDEVVGQEQRGDDAVGQEQIGIEAVPEKICEEDKEQMSGSNQILTGHPLSQTEILFTTKCILKEISPLPKAASTGKSRANRKVGGAQVFTASPFMSDIKAAVQKKKEKENRQSLKKQKQTKRVIFDNENVEPQPAPKKSRSTRVQKQTKPVQDDDEDLEDPYANEDEENDDPACIYCNELFSQSRPKEHWVKCQLCSNWCHTLCAGIPAKKKSFICELCPQN